MNKVDEYILEKLMKYPKLYENRTQVLHKMFFVNGNGLEWVDGELCHDHKDDGRKNQISVDEAMKRLQTEGEIKCSCGGFRKYPSQELIMAIERKLKK